MWWYDTVMQEIGAELIEDRFEATEPRRGVLFHVFVVVVAILAVLFVLVMLNPSGQVLPGSGIILPWLLILTLATAGWTANRARRRCRASVVKAWELIQLGEWDAGAGVLDEVTQQPIRSRVDRAQAFMLLASVAEHQQQYESAGLIYEILLQRRIGDSLQLQQAPIALAAAKLRNSELTDAITLLGRLERVEMPPAIRVAYDLVKLFQQVLMGQNDDAVEELEKRRKLFRRYLSTRAAYGYAFLSLAVHHLGRTDEAAGLWADATVLIKADKLVGEYAMLAPLKTTYTSTEHRL